MPPKPYSYQYMNTILSAGQNKTGRVTQILPPGLDVSLAKMMRKYGFTDAKRIAHFWGQMCLETDNLQTVREYASGMAYDQSVDKDKAKELGNSDLGDGPKYKGRGLIQTTGKSNYKKFADYRKIDLTSGETYLQMETALNCTESAGLYWVSEETRDREPPRSDGKRRRWLLDGKMNIHTRADKTDITDINQVNVTNQVSSVTRQVNRAELHLAERTSYFKHAYGELSDLVNVLPNLRKSGE